MAAADAYPLSQYRSIIDRCFSADSVEDILERLRSDGTSFALKQAAALDQMSPMSLKVRLLGPAHALSFG